MRHARTIGIRRLHGGKLSKDSNLKQLEQDFAKSISFGKAEPPPSESSEKIRKKFSI
jgi:hypothetical protein